MYIDWLYIILILPAVAFAAWASSKVNRTYQKYSGKRNARGITGAQAARFVLDRNGLSNVQIEHIQGNLTDHFDPSANVVRLSDATYASASPVAIGVACHECGHAIQHATNYAPVKIRTAIVPVTNLGAKISMPLILIGLLLCSISELGAFIAYIGIACFALSTVFQLVTLPTEFNASSRALKTIQSTNLLVGEEYKQAKEVLTAAALTYVAALAVSLGQLLRFILLVNNRRN